MKLVLAINEIVLATFLKNKKVFPNVFAEVILT